MFDLFSKGGKDGQAVGRHSEQNLKPQYVVNQFQLSIINILIYQVNFSFNRKYCHNIYLSQIFGNYVSSHPPFFYQGQKSCCLGQRHKQKRPQIFVASEMIGYFEANY